MREVRMAALQPMKSPVEHLMKHIHEAVINIAPERKDEFLRVFPHLIMEYLDDHRWVCDADADLRRVRLSRKVVEVLWAASLAYFRVYNEITDRITSEPSGLNSGVEIDLHGSRTLEESMELLRWALDSWFNKRDTDWPSGLPKPIPHPVHGSDEDVADELCLSGVAFLLHHEFAHVRLGHSGGSKIETELDADGAAAHWILGGLADQRSVPFLKRTMGVALGLQMLLVYGIYTDNYGGITHPRSYDRLLNTLDRYVTDPNHTVWFFVVAMLTLHLDNADHGAAISKGPFRSGRECVDAWVEALSRLWFAETLDATNARFAHALANLGD